MKFIGGVLEFTIDFMGMTILVCLSLATLVMFGWIWPIWWLIGKCVGLIPESLSPCTLLLIPAWAALAPLAGVVMISVLMLQKVRDEYPRVFGDLIYAFKRDSANTGQANHGGQEQPATKNNSIRLSYPSYLRTVKAPEFVDLASRDRVELLDRHDSVLDRTNTDPSKAGHGILS